MGLKSLKVFGAGVSGDLRFLGAEFSQIPVVNFPNWKAGLPLGKATLFLVRNRE